MSRTKTVHIGPQDSSEGQQLTIVRQFTADGEPISETRTYVEYVASGVVDVDIQDPYNMGTGDPESTIGVTFPSGHREYISGVITDIGSMGDDTDSTQTVKDLIRVQEDAGDGAFIESVTHRAEESLGITRTEALDRIEDLQAKGEIYEANEDHYRTT